MCAFSAMRRGKDLTQKHFEIAVMKFKSMWTDFFSNET